MDYLGPRAMSEILEAKCPNPDCDVAETGKCVEGISKPEECPHYGQDSFQVEPTPEKESDIHLSTGEALDLEQANEMLCANSARVIAVVGPADSGKTTLICSFYDLLQLKPFNGYSFAASGTIPAFERRCHRARAASLRSSPDMERTPTSTGLKYLHLGVFRSEDGRIDLLFSDRAGEAYESAAKNLEMCNELTELYRADLVLILVDGKKIADNTSRHVSVMNVKTLLEALITSGMIGPAHRVAIVLTKFDLLDDNKETGESSNSAFDKLVKWIKTNHSGKVKEVLALKTAARPENESVAAGTGLDQLLDECVKARVIPKFAPPTTIVPTRAYHQVPFKHYEESQGGG